MRVKGEPASHDKVVKRRFTRRANGITLEEPRGNGGKVKLPWQFGGSVSLRAGDDRPDKSSYPSNTLFRWKPTAMRLP
jgi:hypothetical protein